MSLIFDDKYNIVNDNPFVNDKGNVLKLKAKNEIVTNSKNYIFYDWKENVHSKDVLEIDSGDYKNSLFGVDMSEDINISDIDEFSNIVKGFFIRHDANYRFSDDLMSWVKNNYIEYVNNNIEESEEIDEEFSEFSEIGNDYFGNEPKVEIISYNFSSDITLTFEEVCKLCLNKARNQLVTTRTRNLDIEKIETNRKNELIDEILKLYEIGEIAIESERDLAKLSISELEELRKRCEIKFDSLKTREMIRTWLSTSNTVYENVFPGGLPIGRGRKLRVKSVGKEFENVILNPRTVSGQAFRRILDKHHIHVSDETMVMSKLVNILIKNAEIVRSDEESEETDEESEEYNEEESSELESVSD